MPHVSRRKLDSRVEQELYSLFEYTLGHLKTKEAQSLLETLLSKTEKLMLAKRLAAFVLLAEGYPESEINQSLKLTPDTISKIALLMETPRGKGFIVAVQKVGSLKRVRLFKKILLEVARRAIRAAGGRS